MKRHGIYTSSFCNFGHDLSDGAPIDHECYVIPPAALEAERGGCDSSHPEWQKFYKNRRHHNGRKLSKVKLAPSKITLKNIKK